MRKGASRNVSQYRLSALLLLTVLLFVRTESTHELPSFSSSDLPTELTQPFARRYRLYNRCSERHLQIRFNRRGVDAKGGAKSRYARLLVETVTHDLITIKSEYTGRFLCFNRRGRLIVRHHGDNIQCQFRERINEENYTELQLNVHRAWYVGFRKQGKPLKGYEIQSKPKCFQFIKREFPEDIKKNLSQNHGPEGLNADDFAKIKIVRRKSRKFRKSRTGRRRKRNNPKS